MLANLSMASQPVNKRQEGPRDTCAYSITIEHTVAEFCVQAWSSGAHLRSICKCVFIDYVGERECVYLLM